MDKSVEFKYSITPMWGIVEEIRNRVENILTSEDIDVRYASKMTTSELIENAVKYGCSAGDKGAIEFSLNKDDNHIIIKVTNGLRSLKDFEIVKAHIDRIAKSKNPQELYIRRLGELIENTKSQKSQLGLYRIAYEGNFSLQYELEGMVLTVTATRRF